MIKCKKLAVILLMFVLTLECFAGEPNGKMIDIGTHKLHIVSMGENFKKDNPAVVFEHGLHCEASYWHTIQDKLAKNKIYSCSYDRAGLGWSEVSPEPRTLENIIQDLDSLLEASQVPVPRILVAHSFGGLCAQMYCAKYPEKVYGMILLDPAHENMLDDMPLKMVESWKYEKLKLSFVRYIPSFALGYFIASQEKEKLIKINYPASCINTRVENIFKPYYFSTLYDEMENIEISFAQAKQRLQNHNKPYLFGDIPLQVYIPSNFEDMSAYGCGKLSNFDEQTQDSFIAISKKQKQQQATRSTQGKLLCAQNCSHRIPLEQPDIVVDAVLTMLQKNN